VDDGTEERWVLLPGFEEKCAALYAEVQNKGVKLEDQTDAGSIVEKGILTRTREFMVEFMRFKADKKAAEAAAKSDAKDELEEQAKAMEDKAQKQQTVVKSLLEQSAQADPKAKAKLEQEAKEASKVLEEYRKNMRQLVDQAAAVAKEAKAAEAEALESEKKAEKGNAKLEKKRGDQDNGRDLPWQAQGENAAQKSTAKDLAEALYGIVVKHAEPEDVLYAMMQLHRKGEDSSNAFKAAFQAFGVTWDRKTKAPEKVPA
jgi:chromosome segregation ATPase